jgi:hypothetical protein
MLYLLLLDEAIVAGVPSRPQIMGVDAQLPAVYLEERLVRKNFVRGGGSDKWKNSGGSKGASVFPLEGPRLACKYGSVTAADAEGGQRRCALSLVITALMVLILMRCADSSRARVLRYREYALLPSAVQHLWCPHQEQPESAGQAALQTLLLQSLLARRLFVVFEPKAPAEELNAATGALCQRLQRNAAG